MEKKKIGANTYLYPMPVVIVGADVKKKPNWITVAFCGIFQYRPPMIALCIGKKHYTNIGIKENKTFSVNTPSEEMVAITDYIGINSGWKTDKSELFDVFYGDLKTAPMIKSAPLNMECKLSQVIDVGGTNEVFVGEIIQTYINESCLSASGEFPDIKRLKTFVFTFHDNNYWKIGEHLGKAWNVGKNYKK